MNHYKAKNKGEAFNKVDIQHSENTIIHIKNNTEINDNLDITGFDSLETYYCKYVNNICRGTKCWNCNYSTLNINTNISIPLKYSLGIFYIYGNFCSYECAARYVLDTYNDKDKWDKYSLLNLYYNISNKAIGEKVTPAPSKLLLKDYGGTMDINEYRKVPNSHNIYNLYQPPIVPIRYKLNLLENKTASETKHNYKLYRKKPINTGNSIYNTMNLTKTSDITPSMSNEINGGMGDEGIYDNVIP